MQCTRLVGLAKKWYLCVHSQTMAPARMMRFIEDHVRQCATCMADRDLPDEMEKIRAILLPPDTTLAPPMSSEDL